MKPRRLGTTQRSVLRALRDHKSWHRHCGWYWDSEGNTLKIMERLVDLGYARKETSQFGQAVYRPTDQREENR